MSRHPEVARPPTNEVHADKVRVIIANQDPVVRRGLRCLIEEHAVGKVVAEARTHREALEATMRLRPDVVVLGQPTDLNEGLKILPIVARVSRASPVEEIKVGIAILESLALRRRRLEIVSCPSCGRAQVDVYTLAERVAAGLDGLPVPLRVAVMGCVVNGPGEAREADLGVASGNGKGQIFVKGKVVKTVPESQIVDADRRSVATCRRDDCQRRPRGRADRHRRRPRSAAMTSQAPASPRRVLLASPHSFCAGVERAIQTVIDALELHGAPIYVRKQIVHNTHVVAELRERGAIFVEEVSEVPEGAVVVFSAHGVAPAVFRQAEHRRLESSGEGDQGFRSGAIAGRRGRS